MSALTDNLNNAWSYTVDNCTRFVAGALSWVPAGLGDAGQWLANAQKVGLPTIGPTATPPPGSVAVWGTGTFGHVAEVTGQVAGGFTVAEENFKGLGIVDTRTVTDLRGLLGFILPPGGAGLSLPPFPGSQAGLNVGAAITTGQALAQLPASIGHGLANAAGATAQNAGVFFRNQLVPLLVALVVAIVLFGGDESKQ